MLIVLGSVTVDATKVPEALKYSQAHVERSRAEPGCISHAVYLDPETEGRLVFVEQWSDRAALETHFKVPASREFIQAISALATEAPAMSIFSAEQQS